MNTIKLLLNLEIDTINGITEEESNQVWKYIVHTGDTIQENLFNKNYYGDALTKLIIIPTLYSKTLIDNLERETGKMPESKIYKAKVKDGFVSLRLDYEKFLISNEKEKKQMILQNIIDSIITLDEKIKKHKDVSFMGLELVEDIKKNIAI